VRKRITYTQLIGKNEPENLPGSDGAGIGIYSATVPSSISAGMGAG
jgi:hypothetical protein